MCRYRNDSGKCVLHAHHFGTFLAVASMTLMIIAALLTILVLIYVKDLDLYNEEENEDHLNDIVELENTEDQQNDRHQTDQILQSNF